MAANPFISNGTCYYEAGEQSDPTFIPCGNDALGHKTCCQAGDMCLSSKACFNLQYMLTYLAGCSDPEYLDDSCPEKPGLDGRWKLTPFNTLI
ncbi:hypothetical protein BR93DRAFT_887961 [Coniochaeta sp. PMI_546]|nr:hypothetical protein BR93DRAFT_887961 [Coniochaeta sp. PMI_546]